MISLFIPILIFSDTWAYPVLISILSVIASFEILKCTGTTNPFLCALTYVFSLVSPLLARLSFIFGFDFGTFAALYFSVFFIYLLITLSFSVFSQKKLLTCMGFGHVRPERPYSLISRSKTSHVTEQSHADR